jgi:hypothetical protein
VHTILTHEHWQGVHAFAVKIREDNGQLTENIRIMDVGPKQGFNGVGMWKIIFCLIRR